MSADGRRSGTGTKTKWDAFEKKCGAYMRQHQELATLLQSLEAYTGGNT